MEADHSQLKSRRSVPSGAGGRSLTVAALILASLLSACGVPGEPLPPLLEIPAPVSDLAAEQVGSQVRLAWSRPLLTTEGTRVRELDRMEIYAAFLPEGTLLTSFPEQAQLLATLPADQVPEEPAQIIREFPLTASQLRAQAFFGIKAINRRGTDAGFSNVASWGILDLPQPPFDLQATVTEEAIRLSWRPAPQSAFGGPAPAPDGYEVYRAEAGTPGPGQKIGESQSPAYDDSSFEFGSSYRYSVRAFVRDADSIAVTPFSRPAEVAAADRFPPAAPENFQAIAVPGVIEMGWSPNAEGDLAGYNVYRSEGGPFTKLNPELLTIPLFRDTSVAAGTRYLYQVRAADRNGNESAPSPAYPVTAE